MFHDIRQSEESFATAWFDETQGLPGCKNYLSRHPEDGTHYEVAPTTVAVGNVLAALLGLESLARDHQADPCQALLQVFGLEATTRRIKYRLPAAEEERWKEVLVVKNPRMDRWLEVALECAPYPTAKVTHRSVPKDWNQVRKVLPSNAPWPFFAALQPDALLFSCTPSHNHDISSDQAAQAILTSRRTAFCDDWQPLESSSHQADDSAMVGLRESGDRSVRAISLAAKSLSADPGAAKLVQWLVKDLPPPDVPLDEVSLGRALTKYPELRAEVAAGRSSLVLGQPTLRSFASFPVATVAVWLEGAHLKNP